MNKIDMTGIMFYSLSIFLHHSIFYFMESQPLQSCKEFLTDVAKKYPPPFWKSEIKSGAEYADFLIGDFSEFSEHMERRMMRFEQYKDIPNPRVSWEAARYLLALERVENTHCKTGRPESAAQCNTVRDCKIIVQKERPTLLEGAVAGLKRELTTVQVTGVLDNITSPDRHGTDGSMGLQKDVEDTNIELFSNLAGKINRYSEVAFGFLPIKYSKIHREYYPAQGETYNSFTCDSEYILSGRLDTPSILNIVAAEPVAAGPLPDIYYPGLTYVWKELLFRLQQIGVDLTPSILNIVAAEPLPDIYHPGLTYVWKELLFRLQQTGVDLLLHLNLQRLEELNKAYANYVCHTTSLDLHENTWKRLATGKWTSIGRLHAPPTRLITLVSVGAVRRHTGVKACKTALVEKLKNEFYAGRIINAQTMTIQIDPMYSTFENQQAANRYSSSLAGAIGTLIEVAGKAMKSSPVLIWEILRHFSVMDNIAKNTTHFTGPASAVSFCEFPVVFEQQPFKTKARKVLALIKNVPRPVINGSVVDIMTVFGFFTTDVHYLKNVVDRLFELYGFLPVSLTDSVFTESPDLSSEEICRSFHTVAGYKWETVRGVTKKEHDPVLRYFEQAYASTYGALSRMNRHVDDIVHIQNKLGAEDEVNELHSLIRHYGDLACLGKVLRKPQSGNKPES
eukprot:TRINITY_DN12516_c0_g1_i1.p1 TRINITY_DN12516_c0_g1~~TRINITY_DN12516_c0_g1_i1.p1  ORF type:complete len:678 (+),score=65.67 TRINITY_DN12516_c0_g1_i1:59-2092(+)